MQIEHTLKASSIVDQFYATIDQMKAIDEGVITVSDFFKVSKSRKAVAKLMNPYELLDKKLHSMQDIQRMQCDGTIKPYIGVCHQLAITSLCSDPSHRSYIPLPVLHLVALMIDDYTPRADMSEIQFHRTGDLTHLEVAILVTQEEV